MNGLSAFQSRMNRARITVLLGILLAMVAAVLFLPVDSLVRELRDWSAADPVQAMIGTTGFIAAGFLLSLPASLLFMLAGFLFGLVNGLAVVWTAGLIASTIAFLLGRYALRDWLERRARRHVLFMAIDRAIRSRGFLVVLLSRIVMLLPFPALNYVLGLTAVRFKDYVAGSNIGMLPPYILFVYLGTTVGDVTAFLQGDIAFGKREAIIGAAALLGILAMVALIARSAGRTLKAELARPTVKPDTAG